MFEFACYYYPDDFAVLISYLLINVVPPPPFAFAFGPTAMLSLGRCSVGVLWRAKDI